MLHRFGLDRSRIPLRVQTGVESRCHDDERDEQETRNIHASRIPQPDRDPGPGIRDSGFGIRDSGSDSGFEQNRDSWTVDRGPWTAYGLKNVNSRPADMTPIHASSDTPPARRADSGGGDVRWRLQQSPECSRVEDHHVHASNRDERHLPVERLVEQVLIGRGRDEADTGHEVDEEARDANRNQPVQRSDRNPPANPSRPEVEDADRSEQQRHAEEMQRLENRPAPSRRPQKLALRRMTQIHLHRAQQLV